MNEGNCSSRASLRDTSEDLEERRPRYLCSTVFLAYLTRTIARRGYVGLVPKQNCHCPVWTSRTDEVGTCAIVQLKIDCFVPGYLGFSRLSLRRRFVSDIVEGLIAEELFVLNAGHSQCMIEGLPMHLGKPLSLHSRFLNRQKKDIICKTIRAGPGEKEKTSLGCTCQIRRHCAWNQPVTFWWQELAFCLNGSKCLGSRWETTLYCLTSECVHHAFAESNGICKSEDKRPEKAIPSEESTRTNTPRT